jgi:hypothetical protein
MNQYNNSYKQLTCPECGKLFDQPALNYHRILRHRIDLPVLLRPQTAEHGGTSIKGCMDRFDESYNSDFREDIMLELCSIGIDAELLDRGLPEEKSGEASLGLILIRGSPIRWINVGLKDAGGGNENYTGAHYYNCLEYAIPDSRPLPKFLARSKLKKTFPLFGRITDVCWEGDKKKLGIAEKLESNEYISDVLWSYRVGVTVITNPKYACWLITGSNFRRPLILDWRCLELIAECLLRVPLK